jgi:hypothetical protein
MAYGFWCATIAAGFIGWWVVFNARYLSRLRPGQKPPLGRVILIPLSSAATAATIACVLSRLATGVWPLNPTLAPDNNSISLVLFVASIGAAFGTIVALVLGLLMPSRLPPAVTTLFASTFIVSALAAVLLLTAAIGGATLVTDHFASEGESPGGFEHPLALEVEVKNASALVVNATAGGTLVGKRLVHSSPSDLSDGMIGSMTITGKPGQVGQVMFIASSAESRSADLDGSDNDDPATLSIAAGSTGTLLSAPSLIAKACSGPNSRATDIRFGATGTAIINFVVGGKGQHPYTWSLPVEDFDLVAVPAIMIVRNNADFPCVGEPDPRLPNAKHSVEPTSLEIHESVPYRTDLGEVVTSSRPDGAGALELKWSVGPKRMTAKSFVFEPVYTISTPSTRANETAEFFFASAFVAIALTMLVELIRQNLREETLVARRFGTAKRE